MAIPDINVGASPTEWRPQLEDPQSSQGCVSLILTSLMIYAFEQVGKKTIHIRVTDCYWLLLHDLQDPVSLWIPLVLLSRRGVHGPWPPAAMAAFKAFQVPSSYLAIWTDKWSAELLFKVVTRLPG